jgi:hypothetical protein
MSQLEESMPPRQAVFETAPPRLRRAIPRAEAQGHHRPFKGNLESISRRGLHI